MSLVTSRFRSNAKRTPIKVYAHAMGEPARNAIFVGFWGSLIYGLLLQLPVRLMFESLITSTPSLTDSTARLGYGVILILPFAGLFVTMMLLRQRWTPRNLSEQLTAIIGLSIVFGMVFNILISSAAFSLLASRDMWSFYSVTPDINSAEFREFIGTAVYQVVTEAGGMSLLHMGLTVLGGIAMGLLFVPVSERKATSDNSCNALLPLLTITLPISLIVIFTVNIVLYTILAPSTANLFTDDARRTLAEFLMPFIQAIPIVIGLLIVQVGLLIALIKTDAMTLHRRATRFAQLIYGLIFGVGQIWYLNMSNPAYILADPGRWIVPASVMLALAWVIVAQWKLRRSKRLHFKQVIELSLGRYMVTLVAVALFLWLFIDLFVIRTAVNLINIVVASIPSEANHVSLSSLDNMLNTAIHGGSVTSLVVLVGTIIIVCVVFSPLIIIFRLLERWTQTV